MQTCRYYLTEHSMCCIIYGVWHDAVVIDCSTVRFGTRWPEVFAITTMEPRKVNDKIFISGMVIRGRPRYGNPFSAGSPETASKIRPEVGARVPIQNFDRAQLRHGNSPLFAS